MHRIVLKLFLVLFSKASELNSKLVNMIVENLKKENIKVDLDNESDQALKAQIAKHTDDNLNSDVESIAYSFKISFNKKI